jgi:hypothetical protein
LFGTHVLTFLSGGAARSRPSGGGSNLTTDSLNYNYLFTKNIKIKKIHANSGQAIKMKIL